MNADAWPADVDMTCPICGRDACDEHLPPDDAPRPAAETPRLVFVPAADLMTTRAPIEIVEGIVIANGMTALVSESGAGKTFLLLHMAAAVSSDVACLGRRVQAGSVAYCSFEGDALGVRLRAIHERQGPRLEHVYGVRAHDPLSPRVTKDGEDRSIGEVAMTMALDALATGLHADRRPPIRLIIIDTVRASLAGSEDNSEHVAAYLRAARRVLATVPDAGLVLAHHAGWQDGEQQRKRERGSSAWRGNVDATVYLEASDYDKDRCEAALTLRTLKLRDHERPLPLHAWRRRVELPERDRYGDPVTSCIIERDARTADERDADAQATAAAACDGIDRTVLQAMRDYPAATSIAKLRPYVNLRTDVVGDAVARILRAGLAVEGRRGQPYTLTDNGLALLNSA